MIDERDWSIYPFLPALVNLVVLALVWPLGASLERQVRTHLRDQSLEPEGISHVINIATDLSVKLSFYAGVVPVLSILAITIVGSELTQATAVTLFAVMGLLGFVVIPYMMFTQPGRLSEQFVEGRLPKHEAWLVKRGVRSYATLLALVYIAGVTIIEIVIAYLQLPKG